MLPRASRAGFAKSSLRKTRKKPYSDQKIVEIAARQGIDIARRTVTKYREMLNIGSSTQRKRLF